MKIKRTKLRNLIENFLNEQESQFNDNIEDSKRELEKEKFAGSKSTETRKQGVKIKPGMAKEIIKDLRGIMLHLIDVRDNGGLSEEDVAYLRLDLSRLNQAAKDIRSGKNLDALNIFKRMNKITFDNLGKKERAKNDFKEIKKALISAIKKGKSVADQQDKDNFLLSPTQDELKTKKKAEEKKNKVSKKIAKIQKLLKTPSSSDGTKLGDGVWGKNSYNLWKAFIKDNKKSILNTSLDPANKDNEEYLEVTLENIINSEYGKKGKTYSKQSLWGYIDIQKYFDKSNKGLMPADLTGMTSFIEYTIDDNNLNKQGESAKEEEKKKDASKIKDSKYEIGNIYSELNKVFKKEKAAKVDLGKIPLGAFNKMRTGNTFKNLFFGVPKTYEKPPKAIAWLGSTWKDNHHGRDDVNVYFEDDGQNTDIIFTDGTSGGAVGGVLMYRIAINGTGFANAIIKGYVAVKENTGKIFLMSVERATKEGHIKSAGEKVAKNK